MEYCIVYIPAQCYQNVYEHIVNYGSVIISKNHEQEKHLWSTEYDSYLFSFGSWLSFCILHSTFPTANRLGIRGTPFSPQMDWSFRTGM